jgi:hypothetical protein
MIDRPHIHMRWADCAEKRHWMCSLAMLLEVMEDRLHDGCKATFGQRRIHLISRNHGAGSPSSARSKFGCL